MSTIDFVHCNRCLARPKNGVPIKIFFTSCYHLFCEKCITDNGTPCPVCKKNKQAVELKRDCDPKILMFFQDPQKMLATNMQTLMRKYNFQMGMVKSLLNAYKKQRERLGQLQQIAQKATSTTREKEEEINELKKWIETAEPKLKAMEAEREDLQRELAELRKVENRINTSNTFDGFMFEKEPNKASFAVSKNFVNPLDNFQVDENMDESGESDSDSMQVIPMSMNTMNSPVPSNSSLLSEITTPKLMGIASRGAEDTYSHRKKTPARAYNPYAELMNQSRAASNHLRTPLHRSPFSNGPGLSKIQSFTPHISRSNGTSQRPFSPNSIMRLGSAGFTPNMIRQTGNIIPKSNTPSFARPF